MVKVFKCKICEEGFIGDERPTHCPFCGAHKGYLLPVEIFKKLEIKTLTEISKKNLTSALEVEIGNAEFYFCAAKKADNITDATMFKRLAKIEAEHASTIAKALGVKCQDISRDKTTCNITDIDNLKESHEREANAINRYGQFLSEATEPRIIEIFKSLIEIETDHLSLSEGKF